MDDLVPFGDLYSGQAFWCDVDGCRVLCAKLPHPIIVNERKCNAIEIGLKNDSVGFLFVAEEEVKVAPWLDCHAYLLSIQSAERHQKLLSVVEEIDHTAPRSIPTTQR